MRAHGYSGTNELLFHEAEVAEAYVPWRHHAGRAANDDGAWRAYWMEQIKQGKALMIGPAADPKGAFGLGILRLENPAELDALMANDPATRANIGFKNEAFPMPRVLLPEGW